jgi:subtilisin family serine protease
MRLPVNAKRRPGAASTRRRVVLLGFATAATAAATVAAMAAGGVASAATQDEAAIRDAGTAATVPDSFVVKLKSTGTLQATTVDASAQRLTSQYGGRISFTYHSALSGFAVKGLSEKQARRLAANPAVEYVQRDGVYKISATQPSPPSWGLDRIDQHNLPLDSSYTYPTTAANVHAYVIDTGIRFSHSTFGGRATSGFDAVDGGSADDCNGHGTHVSGTIGGSQYGVAKGVALVGVRVLDCNGSGTTSGVVAGIDWVTANAIKPAVANMSLGGGADSTLDAAVVRSINSGVTYGIAAGNENQNACNDSPARVAQAITVGATTTTDARASFSNFGTCVDIFAPGQGITSSWNTSDTATNTISGTSMATPHVVGVAALIASANPSFSPAQVRDFMVNNATNGVVGNPGSGSPNKLLFVVQSGNPPPTNDFSVAVSPASGSVAPGGSASATVSTAVTSGSAVTVSLSASGAPAGGSATVTPSSVTAGGTATLNVTTSASTPPGTYTVTVTGTSGSTSHSATFTLTVTGGGGGGCSGTNGTDVSIPDAGAAVSSTITISGCNRNASSSSKVEVHIKHTYRGDLRIDLIAPDGSSYRLKTENISDGADNVDTTYTVNVSSEAANGAWKLQVQDRYRIDTGFLDTWTLTV